MLASRLNTSQNVFNYFHISKFVLTGVGLCSGMVWYLHEVACQIWNSFLDCICVDEDVQWIWSLCSLCKSCSELRNTVAPPVNLCLKVGCAFAQLWIHNVDVYKVRGRELAPSSHFKFRAPYSCRLNKTTYFTSWSTLRLSESTEDFAIKYDIISETYEICSFCRNKWYRSSGGAIHEYTFMLMLNEWMHLYK